MRAGLRAAATAGPVCRPAWNHAAADWGHPGLCSTSGVSTTGLRWLAGALWDSHCAVASIQLAPSNPCPKAHSFVLSFSHLQRQGTVLELLLTSNEVLLGACLLACPACLSIARLSRLLVVHAQGATVAGSCFAQPHLGWHWLLRGARGTSGSPVKRRPARTQHGGRLVPSGLNAQLAPSIHAQGVSFLSFILRAPSTPPRPARRSGGHRPCAWHVPGGGRPACDWL